MANEIELATVKVSVPSNCKKTNLSIDTLDSYTREVANQTFVFADGKPLLCRSLKVVEQGGEKCLQVTIRPDCFEWPEAK